MDYHKFIAQLPDLYDNWGQESVRPKSNQFQRVLEQVRGMNTANVMQLLNVAVECMEPDEVYCEIGCFQGASLIAALLEHPNQIAYAVDDFSESCLPENSFNKLSNNLSIFRLEEQVIFCNQDFEEFLFEFRESNSSTKVGVYFYDGSHDYRSHLIGLLLVRHVLADKSIIILSNCNWNSVKQAIWDFLATHPQCQLILDLSVQNNSYKLWNGLQILSWNKTQKYNYDWSTFQKVQNQSVIQTICSLEFEEKKKVVNALYTEALSLHYSGYYKEAEKKYKEVLHWDTNHVDTWRTLGMLYYITERYQEALDVLLKSLELESSKAIQHYSIGLVLEKIGAISKAIQAYQEAIALDPQWIDAYNNLGNILLEAGDVEQAELINRKAIAANPDNFSGYFNLGNTLLERHQVDEAIEAYERALHLKPHDPDILNNLGIAFEAKNNQAQASIYYAYAYYRQGNYQKAVNEYLKFIENQTGDVHFYLALADCYKNLNQYEEAIKVYRKGISLYPKAVNLYFFLGRTLQEFGRTEEATAVATEASLVLPEHLIFKIQKQLMLPIIYETEEEIDFYRCRFAQGLEELVQQTSLKTPEARNSALIGIGCKTNFYLQYQCKNDLELQRRYGQFVHQVMAANYPQWAKPLPIPPLSQNSRFRIGYISKYMRVQTVGKLMLGWLRNCNRQEFEVCCYYTERQMQSLTQQFQIYSDSFHHISENLEAACKQIISDRLHVLVFLDIGMDPQITQMAGLRLAPVQCMAWGHPITSGLPTIDYYLSSELMEPENAQEHYSEQLVRLPNIGISYAKPAIPEPKKTRLDFYLRDETVVYLSCQSLFKYLPQYDYVFAAIAQRVPQAQFAFIGHASVHITEKLRQRLRVAFAKCGLNSEEYCVILPRQSQHDYFNLNLVSDVYLDTFSWSGGNTTLEAIACNLPVVTCPGEFMRGRHSYGILKMLSVTETIAKDEAEYIEIAVRLGLDREWRNSIVEQMVHHHSYLYDDKTCVAALEAFYRRVVQERQSVLTAISS